MPRLQTVSTETRKVSSRYSDVLSPKRILSYRAVETSDDEDSRDVMKGDVGRSDEAG